MLKYHFTYQTTNLVNQKTYIGVHSTNNLDDGYLGSGVALQKAINKYGRINFKRDILKFFDSSEQAFEEEKLIVDSNWLNKDANYNMCLGGKGGIIVKSTESILKWKQSRQGYTHSKETKQKISQKMKGKILTIEHKSKIGVKMLKQNLSKNTLLKRTKYTVYTPQGIYLGIAEASKVTELSEGTVKYRCESLNFPDWWYETR